MQEFSGKGGHDRGRDREVLATSAGARGWGRGPKVRVFLPFVHEIPQSGGAQSGHPMGGKGVKVGCSVVWHPEILVSAAANLRRQRGSIWRLKSVLLSRYMVSAGPTRTWNIQTESLPKGFLLARLGETFGLVALFENPIL